MTTAKTDEMLRAQIATNLLNVAVVQSARALSYAGASGNAHDATECVRVAQAALDAHETVADHTGVVPFGELVPAATMAVDPDVQDAFDDGVDAASMKVDPHVLSMARDIAPHGLATAARVVDLANEIIRLADGGA